MKVKFYCHAWMLAFFFAMPDDSIPPTRERIDTLREVEVRGDTVLPVTNAIRKSLQAKGAGIKIPSLGDVIDKLSPGLNDKMLHPFAVKQRKKERKHKRDQKILRDYDRVRTIQDLLDAEIARQQLEELRTKSRNNHSEK